MQRLPLRTRARLRDVTKPLGQGAVGALTIGILRTAPLFRSDQDCTNLFGRIARSVGPMMREQKIGRANLTAAFPEKPPAEIEAILAGVWDNLGRVGAEFAHLDHIWEYDPARPEDSRIEIEKRSQFGTKAVSGQADDAYVRRSEAGPRRRRAKSTFRERCRRSRR
jgi:Kdo2-lipid IVA lauroyltransferase/acyltransferase